MAVLQVFYLLEAHTEMLIAEGIRLGLALKFPIAPLTSPNQLAGKDETPADQW